MNTIRSGKIARLPDAIREQLNQRLANHESSTPLLKWLNTLPEVQTLMARDFGGKAVDRHNLHEWRHGGFAEWRRQRDTLELMERLGTRGNEMAAMDAGEVLGTMTTFITARYCVGMKQLQGRGGDRAEAWERLRECCHDILALQRGEYLEQRLKFDMEKLSSRLPESLRTAIGGGEMTKS
jgi:hypothetical protein